MYMQRIVFSASHHPIAPVLSASCAIQGYLPLQNIFWDYVRHAAPTAHCRHGDLFPATTRASCVGCCVQGRQRQQRQQTQQQRCPLHRYETRRVSTSSIESVREHRIGKSLQPKFAPKSAVQLGHMASQKRASWPWASRGSGGFRLGCRVLGRQRRS